MGLFRGSGSSLCALLPCLSQPRRRFVREHVIERSHELGAPYSFPVCPGFCHTSTNTHSIDMHAQGRRRLYRPGIALVRSELHSMSKYSCLKAARDNTITDPTFGRKPQSRRIVRGHRGSSSRRSRTCGVDFLGQYSTV